MGFCGGGIAEGLCHYFCFPEEESVIKSLPFWPTQRRRRLRRGAPAIRQLAPHVFEVGVSHIVDAEDVDVWVFGDAFADVGVEFDG